MEVEIADLEDAVRHCLRGAHRLRLEHVRQARSLLVR
jgi:hypothetical protein